MKPHLLMVGVVTRTLNSCEREGLHPVRDSSSYPTINHTSPDILSLVANMSPNCPCPLISFEFRVRHEAITHTGTEDFKTLLLLCQSVNCYHVPHVDEPFGGVAPRGTLLILVELNDHSLVLGGVHAEDVPALSVLEGKREEGKGRVRMKERQERRF